VFTISTTHAFDTWLDALKDRAAQAHIAARLRKASFGLLGDVKPVGEGVSEMREHFGPGFRLYFVKRGNTLIVMLAGGDKSSQSSDITLAKRLARDLEK
jgi:putative addiction module killer protein